MKIETFIKNEVRKYKKVVERAIQNKKVDLDRLERKKNQYYWNCEEKIQKANLHYTESCRLKRMARDMLEEVDKEFFGVYINGICVGYDFLKYSI